MIRFRESVLRTSSEDLGVRPLELGLAEPEDVYRFKNDVDLDEYERDDAEAAYYQDLASSGAMLTRAKFPSNVSWKLLRYNSVIELECVDLVVNDQNNGKNKETRRIRVTSPVRILPDCISVVEAGASDFVIDFVSVSGFLYTVVLSFDAFSPDCSRHYTDDNATSWRSIKSPLGFQARPPQLLRALSSNILVVALKDGGLVRLDRAAPLDSIITAPFQDPDGGLSLGRLLPWSGHDRVQGHPEVSVRALVCLETVADADSRPIAFVTLSIDRTLRVWSLETNKPLHQARLDLEKSDKSFLLGHTPARLLSVRAGFVAAYIPSGQGLFKLWQLGPALELVDLGSSYEIRPSPPDDSTWSVGDLMLQQTPLTLWVLWRLASRSCVASYEIENPHALWCTTPTDPPAAVPAAADPAAYLEWAGMDEADYFYERVFGPRGYSMQTLQAALPLYAQHYGSGASDWPEFGARDRATARFREFVCSVVGAPLHLQVPSDGDYYEAAASYHRDIRALWIRFTRLCDELERPGLDALALAPCSALASSAYVINAAFTSVVRPLGALEVLLLNRTDQPSRVLLNALAPVVSRDRNQVESMLRVLDAVAGFSAVVTDTAMRDLVAALDEGFSQAKRFLADSRIAYLYDNHIDGVMAESALGTLVTALADIEGLDGLCSYAYEGLVADSGAQAYANTLYGAQFAADDTLGFLHNTRALTVMLLLVVVVSSDATDLVYDCEIHYVQLSRLLHAVAGGLSLFRAGSGATNKVLDVEDAVGRLSVEPSTATGLTFVQHLALITRTPLWHTLNPLANPLAAPQIAVELYLQNSTLLTSYLAKYMPADPVSTLVSGFILCAVGKSDRGLSRLQKASVGFANLDSSGPVLALLSRLDRGLGIKVPQMFGRGVAAYYSALAAVLSESLRRHVEALHLSKLAARTGSESFASQFDYAIQAGMLDEAYHALVELRVADSDKTVVRECVGRLIDQMARDGDAARLAAYPFIGLTRLVSEHLEAKMKETQSESSFGTYARLRYAWCVKQGDFSGAASALYSHLQQLRQASLGVEGVHASRVAISDLYTVVLNALLCIKKPEDRWLLAHTRDDGDQKAKRNKLGWTEDGYRGRRVALSYGAVEAERAEFVQTMVAVLGSM